jgi:DNA-directed RNA polymerase subunit alpha
MSEEQFQFSGFFDVSEFDLTTYERYADLVYATGKDRERFDTLVNERNQAGGAAHALPVAIGLLILNRFRDALEVFPKAGKGKSARYFQANAELALGRYADARAGFEAAAAAGWDRFDCDMQIALTHLRNGDIEAAEKIAKEHKSSDGRQADWLYLAGEIACRRDQREEAAALFEKALELNPDHTGAMFRAACLCDLAGDDEQAIIHYENLAKRPRAHVNALVNLAVIYEDCGAYDRAAIELRRVLAVCPNHARARLFLKDVESSREMMIDEGFEQHSESRDRLLDAPISEFELSVRARNCLKKMNIRSLGDLLKLTEAELLSYKNFGDTSLTEIKALLNRRNLRLGQSPDEIDLTAIAEPVKPQPKVVLPAGAEMAAAKPVSELELSVRARRCLQRMSITTVGDLIQYTEAELLAARNFGATSLTEIKSRLSDIGLQLAGKH